MPTSVCFVLPPVRSKIKTQHVESLGRAWGQKYRIVSAASLSTTTYDPAKRGRYKWVTFGQSFASYVGVDAEIDRRVLGTSKIMAKRSKTRLS